MTPIELVARTFSFQTEDGRFIFRPWGARGPCYLLSPKQRTARAWIQIVFYGGMIAAISYFPILTAGAGSLLLFVIGFAAISHLLYWLFSLGLPQTEKPVPLTREQKKSYLAAYSRELGKPFLLILAAGSWLFTLAGVGMAAILGEWVAGILCAVMFGAAAAMFTWQLRLVRKKRDA